MYFQFFVANLSCVEAGQISYRFVQRTVGLIPRTTVVVVHGTVGVYVYFKRAPVIFRSYMWLFYAVSSG